MRGIGWISMLLTLFASANGVANECRVTRYRAMPVTTVNGYPDDRDFARIGLTPRGRPWTPSTTPDS